MSEPAAAEAVDASKVEEGVRAILDAARRNGALERLANIEMLARELPILYRDDPPRPTFRLLAVCRHNKGRVVLGNERS